MFRNAVNYYLTESSSIVVLFVVLLAPTNPPVFSCYRAAGKTGSVRAETVENQARLRISVHRNILERHISGKFLPIFKISIKPGSECEHTFMKLHTESICRRDATFHRQAYERTRPRRFPRTFPRKFPRRRIHLSAAGWFG